MKIMHVCAGLPLSDQSGVPNYVRNLATNQVKMGMDVVVLGNSSEETYDFKCYDYSTNKIKIFTFERMEDTKSLEKIKKILEEEKIDIVHIHMMLNIDWNLYDIIKEYPYIISLHDYFYICPRIRMVHNKELCNKYDENKCKNCISRLEQNKLLVRIFTKYRIMTNKLSLELPRIPQNYTAYRFSKFKNLLQNAKYVIPVSKRVKQIYEESGIKANYKVLYIGNIAADQYKELTDYTRKNEGKIKIAMIGSFVYAKGAELFIKIAQKADKERFEFHFFGRVDSIYENMVEEANIINHGKYKQEELHKILENIDIGMVLPVWEDNAPQVVMEFLNNHIPVIGTKMGGIPDFVSEKNGFLFDPYEEKDFDKLMNFMEKLDDKKIEELRKNITRTTTTQEHIEQLNQIYELVMRD